QGRALAGVRMTYTTQDGGSFSTGGRDYTGADGVAGVYWTLGNRVGTQRARVCLDAHPGVCAEFRATATGTPQPPTPQDPDTTTPAPPGAWPDHEPAGFTRILHVKGDTKDWGSGFRYGGKW